MQTITVQLIDDHTVLRAGVCRLLEGEPDITVVAESATGTTGIEDFNRVLPDVVVLDISLPDVNGLEVASRILRQHADAHILILSMYEQEAYPRRAIESGVSSYMTKSGPPEELIKAVRRTAQGKHYLEPKLAQRMALQPFTGNKAGPLLGLTEREYEIFLLIAQGKRVREIADLLFVSSKTIFTHRSNTLKKLRASNDVELTRIAIRQGLLEA